MARKKFIFLDPLQPKKRIPVKSKFFKNKFIITPWSFSFVSSKKNNFFKFPNGYQPKWRKFFRHWKWYSKRRINFRGKQRARRCLNTRTFWSIKNIENEFWTNQNYFVPNSSLVNKAFNPYLHQNSMCSPITPLFVNKQSPIDISMTCSDSHIKNNFYKFNLLYAVNDFFSWKCFFRDFNKKYYSFKQNRINRFSKNQHKRRFWKWTMRNSTQNLTWKKKLVSTYLSSIPIICTIGIIQQKQNYYCNTWTQGYGSTRFRFTMFSQHLNSNINNIDFIWQLIRKPISFYNFFEFILFYAVHQQNCHKYQLEMTSQFNRYALKSNYSKEFERYWRSLYKIKRSSKKYFSLWKQEPIFKNQNKTIKQNKNKWIQTQIRWYDELQKSQYFKFKEDTDVNWFKDFYKKNNKFYNSEVETKSSKYFAWIPFINFLNIKGKGRKEVKGYYYAPISKNMLQKFTQSQDKDNIKNHLFKRTQKNSKFAKTLNDLKTRIWLSFAYPQNFVYTRTNRFREIDWLFFLKIKDVRGKSYDLPYRISFLSKTRLQSKWFWFQRKSKLRNLVFCSEKFFFNKNIIAIKKNIKIVWNKRCRWIKYRRYVKHQNLWFRFSSEQGKISKISFHPKKPYCSNNRKDFYIYPKLNKSSVKIIKKYMFSYIDMEFTKIQNSAYLQRTCTYYKTRNQSQKYMSNYLSSRSKIYKLCAIKRKKIQRKSFRKKHKLQTTVDYSNVFKQFGWKKKKNFNISKFNIKTISYTLYSKAKSKKSNKFQSSKKPFFNMKREISMYAIKKRKLKEWNLYLIYWVKMNTPFWQKNLIRRSQSIFNKQKIAVFSIKKQAHKINFILLKGKESYFYTKTSIKNVTCSNNLRRIFISIRKGHSKN